MVGVMPAYGQTTPLWTRIAGYTINTGLAGPATGAVESVWYAPGGKGLIARTASGRVFATADFEQWKLNTDPVPAAATKPVLASSRGADKPEAGIQVVTSGTRKYSLTWFNVYGTDDGRAWLNLTGMNGHSIVGDGFSALAVSPANPLDVTAANRSGVWRSLDGGLSWQGLNEGLPNFPANRLAGQRTVELAEVAEGEPTLAAVTAGKWTPVEGVATEAVLLKTVAEKSGVTPSAAAQAGSMIYAGMANGGMLVSADEGATWVPSTVAGTEHSIDRIWVDSANSQAALAVSGTKLFRTVNGGKYWDEVTGSLNAGAIHGITADSSAGVVYAATDRGVFSGRLSLNAADLVQVAWSSTSVSRDLPIAAAWDVRLNADNTLTVLLDGYGVYETPAPHRVLAPRIVNAADMSDRAAAPGSLISVLGANVTRVRSGQNVYPILLASDQSSQLQVPFEIAPGTLQLAVESSAGVWMAPLNVKRAAPAIFVDVDGTPWIQDAASGLVIDAGTALHAGSTIQVLATGLGRVTPEWPSGVPAPVDSPPAVVAPVTAFLDGAPVRVTRATLAPTFVGNYLVELELPSLVNRGASELRIVVDGEESNRVKLYMEPGVTIGFAGQ